MDGCRAGPRSGALVRAALSIEVARVCRVLTVLDRYGAHLPGSGVGGWHELDAGGGRERDRRRFCCNRWCARRHSHRPNDRIPPNDALRPVCRPFYLIELRRHRNVACSTTMVRSFRTDAEDLADYGPESNGARNPRRPMNA